MTGPAPAGGADDTDRAAPAAGQRVSSVTLAGVALAALLVPLNSTMIAVALPEIARDFDITKAHAAVLVTVYLMAMLVGQPVAGRLVDAVGARRLAIVTLVGFGACSVAGALVSTFPLLVVMRTGQAAFASAFAPSVQTMLREVAPPSERGRAFGLQGSVTGVGAGLGPVIGGLLVGAFGWRAIFAVNVPLVIAILFVLLTRVPAGLSHPRAHRPQVAAPNAERERVFNGVFVAAFSTNALATFAQYGLLLVTPIVLDDRSWQSGAIGAALSTLTLGMIVMSPRGGRLGDRRGRRLPTLVGLAAACAAITLTALAGDDAASALLIVTLLVFGLGLGLATPCILTAGMEAAPEARIGVASGFLSASRYVGSIASSLVLGALVSDSGEGVAALLGLCLVALLCGLATALRLPSRPSPSALTPVVV